MRYPIGLLIILLFWACNSHSSVISQKDQIDELIFLRSSNFPEPGKLYINRCYVVDNETDSPERDSLIKTFVKKTMDTIKGNYDCIGFEFFKKSVHTNESNLKENPRDLDRYSIDNDLIWQYSWYKKGNYLSAFKYKNGEIIYPPSSGIKVEDIKKRKEY